MLVNSMLGLLAVATMAVAQTIETATAASVSATTTQSESMPAVATQAFNANAVNSTTKCRFQSFKIPSSYTNTLQCNGVWVSATLALRSAAVLFLRMIVPRYLRIDTHPSETARLTIADQLDLRLRLPERHRP